MMRRFLLIGLLMLLFVFTIAAQDTVDYEFAGLFTVSVPESWEIDLITGEGYFWKSDDSIIRIRSYSPFFLEDFELTELKDILEYLAIDSYEAREFDEDALEEIAIGDFEGLSYTFEQNEDGVRFNRTLLVYELESGFYIMGNIRPIEAGEVAEADLEAVLNALPTVVQSNIFNMYEGTVIEIPEGWELTHAVNAIFARLSAKKDGVELRLLLWPGYGANAGSENPLDFLPWIYRGDFIGIEPFQPSKLEEETIAGFDAARYEFEPETLNENETYDRALFTFDLPNNSAFTVLVVSDNPDDDIEIIFELLDTLVPGRRFVCALFADEGTRIREEPDTNSELVRQTFDETLVAFSTVDDDSGNRWFNVGEGYIRSDVIFFEQNPCNDIPEE